MYLTALAACSEIQTKPWAGTHIRTEKAIRLPEKAKVFGQAGAASLEQEPCPFQHQENVLTDLKAERIGECKRLNLITCDLAKRSKAFRDVAALPPLDDAAKFPLGCDDRRGDHPPLVLFVPLPYS